MEIAFVECVFLKCYSKSHHCHTHTHTHTYVHWELITTKHFAKSYGTLGKRFENELIFPKAKSPFTCRPLHKFRHN